jgi:hypothetical protein
MLAIIVHPRWSALRDDHLSSLDSCIGIKVYNHTCEGHTGRGDSLAHRDNLLHEGRLVWGLAVDDAHYQLDDVGGGWIVAKAPDDMLMNVVDSGRAQRLSPRRSCVYEDYPHSGPEHLEL